jgi:hypothetical protein
VSHGTQIRIRLGQLGKSEPTTGTTADIYTGVFEKYDLKARAGEEHLEALTVKTDATGRVVAVLLGSQLLPFNREIIDREATAGFQRQYQRGLAGRILGLVGERPKGRS